MSNAKNASRRSSAFEASFWRSVPRAVARVHERLVGMRRVVGGERRAQHHRLAADLDAPGARDPLRDSVEGHAGDRRDVLARRPVAARRCAHEPPALVDDRQREPVELGHDHDALAGEPRHERLDLLGARRLVEREHRALVADRRVQHGRRADDLEGVRVGGEVGVLGQQRAELVLELVVLEVRDPRRALVVGGAVGRERGGELLDAGGGVGGGGHGAGVVRGRSTDGTQSTSRITAGGARASGRRRASRRSPRGRGPARGRRRPPRPRRGAGRSGSAGRPSAS